MLHTYPFGVIVVVCHWTNKLAGVMNRLQIVHMIRDEEFVRNATMVCLQRTQQ